MTSTKCLKNYCTRFIKVWANSRVCWTFAIIATLEELDRDALIDIVTKPKNALVKQYKKLFAMDDVELEFEMRRWA